MPVEVNMRSFVVEVPGNIQIGAITHLTPSLEEVSDASRIGAFWAVLVLRERPICWLLCRETTGSDYTEPVPGVDRSRMPGRN